MKNKGKKLNDKALKKSGNFRKINDDTAAEITDMIYFLACADFDDSARSDGADFKKKVTDIIMGRKWEYSHLFRSCG